MKDNEKNKKNKLANSILEVLKTSNAFTLIELLAIIVILAIIAVITVPIILNVIDNAKKGSIKDSAYGFKDAVNKYYVSELYDNQNLKLNGDYTITDKGELSDGTNTYPIQVSGTIPSGGILTYENNVLKNGCITIDEYKATIENGEVTTVEKGSCESMSLTSCGNHNSSPENWFTFDASTNIITGFSDAWDGTTDIVIPCQINGLDVVNIGDGSFSGKSLTRVVIPDSVINIGQGSFSSNAITELELGKNVENIGTAAFVSNQLSSLIIPNSVITIGDAAFNRNKLTNLVIGNNVEAIGNSCFYGNQLTELILPDSVTYIDFENAFVGNNISHLVLGKGITNIQDNAFKKENGFNLTGKIVIPGSVKTIGTAAFYGHSISEVVFEEGVEVIGIASFGENELKEVIIPDSVINIRNNAFYDNEINKLSLGQNVETIEYASFVNNSLTDVTIPNSVVDIGNSAFEHNKINNLKLGDNLVNIGVFAFSDNDLNNVIIPENVNFIGSGAFKKYYATICVDGQCNEKEERVSNSNLIIIHNNTGKSFDWYSIINDRSGTVFETGIVENQYGNVEIKKSN